MEKSQSGLSFGFSKKKESKKLVKSVLDDGAADVQQATDFVTAIDDKEISSTIKKVDKPQEYVIPLPKKISLLRDKMANTEKKEKDDPNDLEQQAIKELSSAWEKRDEPEESSAATAVVPLLLQRTREDQYEAAEDPNYDAVPADQFGLALLRGMGWKEGRGIGLRHEKNIAAIEHQLRPKGLGLGAEKSAAEQKKLASKSYTATALEEEEQLEMKRGAHCVVISGRHSDLYGTVEGTDEDTGRVFVHLTVTGGSVNLSQAAVRLCTKQEFTKYSKYINKSKVDKYKQETAATKNSASFNDQNGKGPSRCSKGKEDAKADLEPEVKRQKLREPPMRMADDRPWLLPDIRVRYIKSGKFYNEKIKIVDVLEPGVCTCQTDSGKFLDDVKQKHLETVIPRSQSAHVMVVRGRRRGQLALLVNRDKAACRGTLQLVQDPDTALTLSYDDFCEYVGDVC